MRSVPEDLVFPEVSVPPHEDFMLIRRHRNERALFRPEELVLERDGKRIGIEDFDLLVAGIFIGQSPQMVDGAAIQRPSSPQI